MKKIMLSVLLIGICLLSATGVSADDVVYDYGKVIFKEDFDGYDETVLQGGKLALRSGNWSLGVMSENRGKMLHNFADGNGGAIALYDETSNTGKRFFINPDVMAEGYENVRIDFDANVPENAKRYVYYNHPDSDMMVAIDATSSGKCIRLYDKYTGEYGTYGEAIAYEPGTWVSIGVERNLADGISKLYVNGEYKTQMKIDTENFTDAGKKIIGFRVDTASNVVADTPSLFDNFRISVPTGSVKPSPQYHKLLFENDFEKETNIRKRTDMWTFGGATAELYDRGDENGKAVKLLVQNGKRFYMNPEILAPEFYEPTEEEAKPLLKTKFECDLKIDSDAKISIRGKLYDNPNLNKNDLQLVKFENGKIFLLENEDRAIGAYDDEWHTYEVELDTEDGLIAVSMDGEPLTVTAVGTSLFKRTIGGFAAFGLYAHNETTDKYLYVDNMKVYSATADIDIEINGENEGTLSYVLNPSLGENTDAALIMAVYKDGLLIEAKTIKAHTDEDMLELSMDYSIGQDMELNAFCVESMTAVRPLTQKKVHYALTESDCEKIRNNWREYLVGNENSDLTNKYKAAKIKEINSTANSVLKKMNMQSDASVLFGTTDVTTTGQMTSQYQNMYRLALAYGTYGATFYKDEALKEKILYAMEWLYENLYGADEINGTGWRDMDSYNWYDWYCEVPEYLFRTMFILGDELSQSDIEKYIAPFEYLHSWQSKGENVGDRISRLSNSTALAVLTNDIPLLRKNIGDLQKILPVAGRRDGYREDGMFIFHTSIPYTGLYGANTLAGTVLPISKVLRGVNGVLTDEFKALLLKHMKNTYAPVVYKGRMMSMLMGRAIGSTEEKYEGLQVVRAVLEIIDLYDGEDREYLENLIRRNIPEDETQKSYYVGAVPPEKTNLLLEIINEQSTEEYTECKVYYTGDRVVQRRNGYAVGLSMSSERITNYESINSANKKGWFTGDGMLYVYTLDGYENQYTNEYWNNVDMAKIPGTTEDMRPRKAISIANTNAYKPPVSFVGGVEFDGEYAVAAMDFKAFSNENQPTSSSDSGYGGELEYFVSDLSAKKAWFMFDDEVVALGAGITSTTDEGVNTYLANFKLDGSENLSEGEKWLHLDKMGGIYLPEKQNTVIDITDKNFFEMWISHGKNPEEAKYEYVLLPGKTASQTESYAQNCGIEILSNTKKVQAVRENNLGITGIVFHEAGSFNGISVTQPIVLMYTDSVLKLSDPTQKLDAVTVAVNGKTINVNLAKCKGETLTFEID